MELIRQHWKGEEVVEIHPVVKGKNILTYDLVMPCGPIELKK